MRAIIVDDDKPAIDLLAEALAAYPDIELVGTAQKGASGLRLMEEVRPDVLFLDVEMPDMSGLDFLEEIGRGNDDCAVVMCTAYENYMLPAFRCSAFDFLLKPIDRSELDIVMQRLVANMGKPKKKPQDGIGNVDDDNFIFYTNSVDFRMVRIKDIGVFQYNHDMRFWEVVVAGSKTPIRLKRNVTNDRLLSLGDCFRQVNQKYIININYLFGVQDNICRFYPPFDSIDYVKVGRFFRRRFIEQFNKF